MWSSYTKIDYSYVIAHMDPCSVSDKWYMLARRCVCSFACYSVDDFLSFWLYMVYLTTAVFMWPELLRWYFGSSSSGLSAAT